VHRHRLINERKEADCNKLNPTARKGVFSLILQEKDEIIIAKYGYELQIATCQLKNWNVNEKKFANRLKRLHGLSPRAKYTDGVGEVIANFCGSCGQRDGSLRSYSRFSRQESLLFYQLAPQLCSRG
jgi:hypothetical protein